MGIEGEGEGIRKMEAIQKLPTLEKRNDEAVRMP
jgi:hypothetical protein